MLIPAIVALALAGLFAALWRATRMPGAAAAGIAWLLYAPYEFSMYTRVLCSGECNIRVDLLLVWPALLGVSLAVPIRHLVRRSKAPRGASDGRTQDLGTTLPLRIRDEVASDVPAIGAVTLAAFEPLEISSHTEQFIVEALRAANALTISLVAELDGNLVGHIAFSPVTISDGTTGWYGLGPVSVLPAHQRQGIGEALIREGLSRLQAMHAAGCCLVGHPDYYPRFGFVNPVDLAVEGVPANVFFALSFTGRCPRGTVIFHEGFHADGHAAA